MRNGQKRDRGSRKNGQKIFLSKGQLNLWANYSEPKKKHSNNILIPLVINAFTVVALYPDDLGMGSDFHLMKKHILSKTR